MRKWILLIVLLGGCADFDQNAPAIEQTTVADHSWDDSQAYARQIQDQIDVQTRQRNDEQDAARQAAFQQQMDASNQQQQQIFQQMMTPQQ